MVPEIAIEASCWLLYICRRLTVLKPFGASMQRVRLAFRHLPLFLQAAIVFAWFESVADAQSSSIDRQRQSAVRRFHAELGRLATWCAERSLTDGTTAVRRWQAPVDPAKLASVTLPATVAAPVSLDLDTDERHWRIQLRTQRQKLAHELYLLSRRSRRDDPAFSWQLIHEAAFYDSDHEQSRRLLGFERLGSEWLSPFAASQRKKNLVWSEQFGWLSRTHLERYGNGERYFRGRWYSAERAEALRSDFRNAWSVETDHYRVKTNVSLEKGVELARLLEEYNDWFRGSFPSFFNTPEQLRRAFAGTRRKRTPYDVHFYRTKKGYVDRLKAKNPQIAITNGIYMPDERVAHFFDDPGVDIRSTLFHEATHQILYELYPDSRRIAEQEHFWIIEGFACYMESFRRNPNGVITIGDPSYIRFDAANYRLVKDNYYVPLEQFAAMGKRPFQTHREIRKNYSQASGLAHFFLHYQDGLYRDALIQHVAALYRPVRPGTRVAGLDQLLRIPPERLDVQYREYIRELLP